jgi:MoaA/NifB/PqqE/SkfB family radical SAM enzyme
LEHFAFAKKTGARKSLIFVGHYPHYPNEEAVVYFCRRIFPLIRKKIPDVTLKLVGSSPTREVMKLSNIEGIEVVGTVPDVNPYLQEASCFVTPFRRSAGIRGKVLEAFATGTPVVSTTKGACGIRALHGREILIADNPREFAKCVIELLTNDELYKRIASGARKLAEDEYDWNKIAGQLDSFYQTIIQEKSIDTVSEEKLKPQEIESAPIGEVFEQGEAVLPPEKLNTEGLSCADAETKLFDQKASRVALLPEEKIDVLSKSGSLVKNIIKKIDKIIGASLDKMGKDVNRNININPEELHIELTHCCNSKCITCDIWDYHLRNNKAVNDELSLDEIVNLIEKTRSLKEIKTVILSGGEPFLRKDLVDISILISKILPQASLGILTNGLDSENIISKSKEITRIFKTGSFWIGSSLDGLGIAYDQMRGVKGGFERFANTVERFRKELSDIKLSVTFVLTPFNFEELLPCWDFAERHGLDFFAQFGVPKPGRSKAVFEWRENDLRKIEAYIFQIIEKLIAKHSNLEDFSNSLSVTGDKINILTKIYYWAHLVDFQRVKSRFFYRCDAGFKFAMFDPYGNLFLCPLLKEKTIGNIRNINFDELWVSRNASQVRDFIDTGGCSCWLVCTVFPIVDKALTLYGDKIAEDLKEVRPTYSLESISFKDSLNKEPGPELNNEEFRSGKVVLRSLPQGLTLGTNYKCNADCIFCLGGEYRSFSLDLYKKYFEPNVSIMLKNASHVSFCGMGELLLTQDIEEFLDYINMTLAKQNKILTTNGLPLNENIMNRLIKSKYSLQVSLHASNSSLHAHLTGMQGGFERIIEGIQNLALKRKDSQSPYIVLVFLVNTLNIEDLPNFVGLAASLGVDCVQCNYLTIFNPAHLKLSCFFKQKITNEMFDLAREKADKFKIPLVLPPRFSNDKDNYFKSMCSEPWRNIYVDTEGAVLPCCYAGEHFGELKDADILSIWNNKKYQELRAGVVSQDGIGMCKYCLNNNPDNVNLLNSHVSFRPDVQKKIFGGQK